MDGEAATITGMATYTVKQVSNWQRVGITWLEPKSSRRDHWLVA